MLSMIKRLMKEEEGQGMTEYALVLGVIAVGAIILIGAFREQVELLWGNITATITDAVSQTTP